MRLVRLVAAIIIAAASLSGAYRLAWPEYRCNLALRRVRAAMEQENSPSDFVLAVMARRNLELLDQECARCRTQRVDYLLIKGGNEVLLHRYTEALTTYRSALRFDRRPEIYLDAGLTELDQGNYDEGVRDLIAACAFNFAMSAQIPEPARTEVATRVNDERQRIVANLKRNRQ
jgi:tetratricopeptide (TPR) repeat protein